MNSTTKPGDASQRGCTCEMLNNAFQRDNRRRKPTMGLRGPRIDAMALDSPLPAIAPTNYVQGHSNSFGPQIIAHPQNVNTANNMGIVLTFVDL